MVGRVRGIMRRGSGIARARSGPVGGCRGGVGRGSSFNENVADVVRSDMDGIGNARDAENTFGGAG